MKNKGETKNIRKKYRYLMMGILCAALMVLLFPITIPAQEPVTLRVSFCPLEGFFEYDANGKETGYGVELLEKITQYSGIRFEYVKAKDWEDTRKQLLNGEADLRMPATNYNHDTELSYSENAVISTGHVLMTKKDREDLYYEDYEVFPTLKIGILKSMYQNLSLDTDAENFGFGSDQFVFYDTFEECYQAMEKDEIDAVVSNILDMGSDTKILMRFDSVLNYITMSRDNPDLMTIDSVISQILSDNPEYLSDLYEKWFPERNVMPLTRAETEYIQSLGTLTFVFQDGEGYLSMKEEEGNYTGFYPKVAAYLCDNLGISCRQVSAVDQGESKGTNNMPVVYPDCYFDYNWADSNKMEISLPYFTAHYYEVKKKNANPDYSVCKIAAVSEKRITQDFLSQGFQDEQIVWCSDEAQCIQAVENGEADITFVGSYSAEYYLSMYRYSNLSYSLTSFSHQVSLGIQGDEDGMLLMILDKLLNSFSDDRVNEIMTESTNSNPNQDILQEWIFSKPVEAIVLISVIGTVLVAALMVTIFASRTRRQNQKLKNATAAKSDFLARMSHDIRTPLNVIIGMNRLAQDNDNPPDTRECLQKIEISSEFLLGLINDVLDMERVENGKMELHLTPYSGADFRNYIETIIAPLCEQKNIKFRYRYDSPRDVTLMQDKLKINQIYFNLLSNAVKYTPEGGFVEFYTKVEFLSETRAALHVRVEDNGIGMSEEFQKHMFEAFSQENQVMTSVSQGTGLGLTIVKRMCDLMHMKIQVESELGKGTIYRIYGEYDIALEDAVEKKEHRKKIDKEDYTVLAGKTILVCEDHMLNQEIIRRLLEKQKIIVDLVEDGKKGLDKFATSSPGTYDGILMDIRMPIMNGLEATTAIRSLNRADAAEIPIIAMTANAYQEDVEKSLEAGMNAHLAKPIDPELLYQKLVEYLS